MTSVFDALNQDNPGQNTLLHAALVAGVDVLGQNETATFWPYVRVTLPIDGFVFWINATLLSPEQLAQHGITSSDPVIANGTLHYSTQGAQLEDETIVIRSVDFTSQQPIDAFGALAADVMYVCTWQTELGPFQFTFSRRGGFFVQSNLYHYVGEAVFPPFIAQLIDDISQFDQRQVVSNSLPFWFEMMANTFQPAIPISPPNIQLYPAFLVPGNIIPAYGTVSIPPEGTNTFSAAPVWASDMSRSQLCSDRVRITFYGLRNDDVMDFLDYSLLYSQITNNFGLMNMPVPRDDRRTQVEMAALAQKKYIDYVVSYQQSRARSVARQLIQRALVTIKTAPFTLKPAA